MRVNVITPWYPDYANPYSGIFVSKQVEWLRIRGNRVTVEVPVIFPSPAGPIPDNVRAAISRLGHQSPEAMYLSEGETTWIPTPVPARSGFQGRAVSFASSLELKRDVLPVDAEVTHAHLGVPTGWASLQVGDRPLVVTEHQSTLSNLLAQPPALESYRQTLSSAAAFICVSKVLKGQLTNAFGSWVDDKVRVIPNIVDLAHIPFRVRLEPTFRSWVYVGSLSEHKGVVRLVETFLAYRNLVDKAATLTLLGTGPLASWIAEKARGAVVLAGAVPHDRVGSYLDAADVMVHLSPRETFGLASLEALGAGLPVVSAMNGGSEEAWGDIVSEAGLLVDDSAGPTEIATAIAGLRDHPERLDPETGRRWVETRYGAEAIADLLTAVYEGALR